MTYNILVADDELLIRKAIISRLNKLFDCIGMVYEAENGHQAVEIYEKHRIDIVLTDIRMPVVDGLGLMRHVYENRKPYPVRSVVISGYAEFEYAERAINYDVSGYLLKPIQKQEFIKVMNKVFAELEQNNTGDLLQSTVNRYEQNLNHIFIYGSRNDKDKPVMPYTGGTAFFGGLLVNVDGVSYLKSEFDYEDKKLLKFSVMNIIGEILDGETECCYRNYMDDNTLIILIKKNEAKFVEDALQRLGISIIHKVNKYLNSSLTIGASQVHESLDKGIYDEAVIALDSRFSYGKGKIYHYNSQNLNDYYGFAKGKLSLVEKCIEKRDLVNIKRVLVSVFRSFETELEDKSFIRLLIKDIMMLLYKDSHINMKANGPMDESQKIQSLTDQCENIDEICDKLVEICSEIIGKSSYLDKKETAEDMLLYIREHFNEDIYLEDIADIYNLSSNYVYTMLKQETGMSYKQHVKKLRMDEAKRLLKETEIPIGDISEFCGYNDALYFSRLFKKEVGMSPSEFRVIDKEISL